MEWKTDKNSVHNEYYTRINNMHSSLASPSIISFWNIYFRSWINLLAFLYLILFGLFWGLQYGWHPFSFYKFLFTYLILILYLFLFFFCMSFSTVSYSSWDFFLRQRSWLPSFSIVSEISFVLILKKLQ